MRKKAYRDSYAAAHVSNTVASQIEMLREERGWTQQQLAERAGMKQSRISVLEDPNNENFEIGTLRRIASAFDVALLVRFTAFSQIVDWAANLSEQKLWVPSFQEDSLSRARPQSSPSLMVISAQHFISSHGVGAFAPNSFSTSDRNQVTASSPATPSALIVRRPPMPAYPTWQMGSGVPT